MSEVVIGGGVSASLTPEEQARQARRVSIQTFVNSHLDKPDEIITAMMTYGVDAAEITEAMKATVNMVHYLRRAGVYDGFGGLKVWPQEQVQRYLDYVKANSAKTGWGLPGVVDPVEAQDVLDRVARLQHAMPSYVPPWDKQ